MKPRRLEEILGREYALVTLTAPRYHSYQTQLAKYIHAHMKKKDNVRVLEIGCGTGYTTRAILKKNSNTHITSIDTERSMLRAAKRTVAPYTHHQNAIFIHAEALNFLKQQPQNSFDVVASGFTLHNIKRSHRNRIFKEIYRVLANDGLFINADKHALDEPDKNTALLMQTIRGFITRFQRIKRADLARDWTIHYLTDNREDTIMREKKTLQLLKRIGFPKPHLVLREGLSALMHATK